VVQDVVRDDLLERGHVAGGEGPQEAPGYLLVLL
jgi:hypothetical protein